MRSSALGRRTHRVQLERKDHSESRARTMAPFSNRPHRLPVRRLTVANQSADAAAGIVAAYNSALGAPEACEERSPRLRRFMRIDVEGVRDLGVRDLRRVNRERLPERWPAVHPTR
jgi:hypothetical protein